MNNKHNKYSINDIVQINDSVGIIAEKRENDVLIEFGLTTMVYEYADIDLVI